MSGLAEAAGERVGNASHHLWCSPRRAWSRRRRSWPRTAASAGGGRCRPSVSWSIADVAGDPVGEVVASAAEQQNLAHHVGKVQQWYGRREDYDVEWVRAAFSNEVLGERHPGRADRARPRINDLIVEYGAFPERQQADPTSGARLRLRPRRPRPALKPPAPTPSPDPSACKEVATCPPPKRRRP